MSEEAGEGGGWLDEDDARDGEGKAGKSSNVIQRKQTGMLCTVLMNF